jgi:hypothetical protein
MIELRLFRRGDLRWDGRLVYVNPDYIVSLVWVDEYDPNQREANIQVFTQITVDNGLLIEVHETPEEILKMITPPIMRYIQVDGETC